MDRRNIIKNDQNGTIRLSIITEVYTNSSIACMNPLTMNDTGMTQDIIVSIDKTSWQDVLTMTTFMTIAPVSPIARQMIEYYSSIYLLFVVVVNVMYGTKVNSSNVHIYKSYAQVLMRIGTIPSKNRKSLPNGAAKVMDK